MFYLAGPHASDISPTIWEMYVTTLCLVKGNVFSRNHIVNGSGHWHCTDPYTFQSHRVWSLTDNASFFEYLCFSWHILSLSMPSIGVVRPHWLCALLSYVRQCFLCLTSLSSWSFSGSRTTVISHHGHMWETNCMSRSNFSSDSPHFWEDSFPFVRPKLIHFFKEWIFKEFQHQHYVLF